MIPDALLQGIHGALVRDLRVGETCAGCQLPRALFLATAGQPAQRRSGTFPRSLVPRAKKI